MEKLHIVLDFSEWQRFSPEEQEEIRKAKRKLKSFELVLTMADFDEHYKGKNEFTIPGCVTKIEDDVLDKLKTLKIKIKVEIAKDSCVELFKLLSRCCDNKVIANIEGKDIDIEIGKGVDEDDDENIYFECRYDELRSKGISIKSVPAWITIYYEIPKDKNNFKKFKKAKYKYGNKIITRINGINVDIQVYKDDDGNRYCECSYDELLEKRINIESVPYRITIYYEITNDKNNFGAFKKAKYKHESGIIARIDGHDVDIEVDKDDYGNLYCECSYDNYTNILPTYSFIRQKLYIYFESCNELIKTVSNGQEVAEKQLEPKDIIALIENFKKKHGCNGVMARLTKDDIDLYIDKNDTSDRKESSIAIPEYVKKITDDAFDNLKEDVTEMTIEGKYLLGRANVHELIRRMASLRTIYVPDDVDITLLKRYLMKPSIEIEYISKKPKK